MPDHTATTVVPPVPLSGVTTHSVVGTRPVEGGTCIPLGERGVGTLHRAIDLQPEITAS